jgi:hypothetical protein
MFTNVVPAGDVSLNHHLFTRIATFSSTTIEGRALQEGFQAFAVFHAPFFAATF